MAGIVSTTPRLVPGLIESPTGAATGTKATAGAEQPKFSDMVSDLLESVNKIHQESGQMQQAFAAGEPVELHQLMIKAEEAGVATDLILEIRNRLVDGYREIMKMPM